MNLKKKIIMSLGIAAIAMTMFFNTNTTNNNTNLANLIALNTANAEEHRALVENCDEDDMTSFCQPTTGGTTVGCEISWFWDDCYITINI